MASSYWVPEEITIPHPFGSVSAKAWGHKSNHPVLAVHGWLDNAGTFDRLIPLLTPSLYVVAIDAPGHGLSCHKPNGAYYSVVECLIDMQRIIKHLKWERFSIIGHSMGGAIALTYASVFPDNVLNVVSLDMIKSFSRPSTDVPRLTQRAVANAVEFESKLSKVSPVYSLEDAKERLIKGLFNEVTAESADILMARGVKKSECGTGYVFTRDFKLKLFDFRSVFSHELLKAYMSRLKCNLMIISASDTVYKSSSPEVLQDFLDIYEKHCNSFMHITVNGTHFVHLNEPHVIAPYINHFFSAHLNEVKSKL